jgi:hypothetical protein
MASATSLRTIPTTAIAWHATKLRVVQRGTLGVPLGRELVLA